MPLRRLTSIVVGLLLVAADCGSPSSTGSPAGTTTPGSSTPETALSGSILVNAAASLTGVFGTLGDRFEAIHPGTTIEFNFGSSAILEEQIANGASADVFASADTEIMDRSLRAGHVEQPLPFASNALAIVVRQGNPRHIATLKDLTKADVVALCASKAPCGAKAEELLGRADVRLDGRRITRGQDVKATLRQVTAGDADAAIVYVTDGRTVGASATMVPIPAGSNVRTTYPIAVVKTSGHKTLARAWITFVRGPEGQAVLRSAGFSAPV